MMKSVVINDDQHEAIKILAAKERISMTDMLARLIDKGLTDYRAGKGSENARIVSGK